jgi:uncharacterized repeat protein (TIGR01451 family)
MKNIPRYIESMCLVMMILMALSGFVQAEDPYRVVIMSDVPPYSPSVTVGAGDSVDMRVVILNVTDPVVAGSSLYLSYDPQVISGISCVKSIYKEHNSCKGVQPGRYMFEGYDTFGKYSGDVIVAVLRLTANASASAGSSCALDITGQRLGASLGTPVWGPFWQAIRTPLESGRLTIGDQESSPGIQVEKTVDPMAGAPSTNATFNITVRNTGNVALNNITIIDSIPEGMRYISSDKPTENITGRVVTWNDVGSLLSNDTPVSIKMIARVDQEASGNLTNSVQATGIAEDAGKVVAKATTNFTVIRAGLQVEKKAFPQVAGVMFPVTFIIRVKNTGNSTLHNVTLTDMLPAGLIYLSSRPHGTTAGCGKVIWDLGALNSQESRFIKLVAKVGFRAGCLLENKAIVVGSTASGSNVTGSSSAVVEVDRDLNMAYITA